MKRKSKKQIPRARRSASIRRRKIPDYGIEASPKGIPPVVGIGASAGGLDAFKEFFKNVPDQSNMAFVVVSHLDPTHVSILPELIQRLTKTTVRPIEHKTKLTANTIYIAPPSKEVGIKDGMLLLLDPFQLHAARLPINYFFTSLAAYMGNKAIGIILSGTGTDGTLGCRAIKDAGGMVMVQEILSAKYNGMPGSVIASGCADFVSKASDMPRQLVTYIKHPVLSATVAQQNRADESPDALLREHLLKIFALLKDRTGHDFSFYKQSTIARRIERRMSILQCVSFSRYIRLLGDEPDELDMLFRELLIAVTGFFRDAHMFEILQNKILPKYLKNKKSDYPLRLWIPGCSTGEEVYSMVITIMEVSEALRLKIKIQVFATDIGNDLLRVARAGVYQQHSVGDIKKELLNKYFVAEESGYRVKKHIREKVIFASQSIAADPPFSKIDIVCCRNVLIYLDARLQRKVLPMFFYSLKPQGILILGPSETVGVNADLFKVLDRRWKIFQRRDSGASAPASIDFPVYSGYKERYAYSRFAGADQVVISGEKDVSEVMPAILLSLYAPASMLVDVKGNILYVHGSTGKYLEPASGRARFNAIDMARKGLSFELAAAIRKASLSRKEVTYNNLKVKTNGAYQAVNLSVRPLVSPLRLKGFLLVSFDPVRAPTPKRVPGSRSSHDFRVRDLEEELRYAKESLQTTVEELETSNEELKSSNEEMQSNNEELQSSNEELETSKEELQSLNEELSTINAELQGRIDELSAANDDIKNLFDSTEIAVLFLDSNCCIKRYTPKVKDVINVIAADIGRSIGDLSSRLMNVNLAEEVKKVVSTLLPATLEVRLKNGRTYVMRIMPYRTARNVIDGAVVTFSDMTERELRRIALERIASVIAAPEDVVILQDLEGLITAWNRQAEIKLGYSAEEMLGRNIEHIVSKEALEEYRRVITKIKSGEGVASFTSVYEAKDGTTRVVSARITKLKDEKGVVDCIAIAARVNDRQKR